MRANARTRVGTSLRGSIVLANAMYGRRDAVRARAAARSVVASARRREALVVDAVVDDDDLAAESEPRRAARRRCTSLPRDDDVGRGAPRRGSSAGSRRPSMRSCHSGWSKNVRSCIGDDRRAPSCAAASCSAGRATRRAGAGGRAPARAACSHASRAGRRSGATACSSAPARASASGRRRRGGRAGGGRRRRARRGPAPAPRCRRRRRRAGREPPRRRAGRAPGESTNRGACASDRAYARTCDPRPSVSR